MPYLLKLVYNNGASINTPSSFLTKESARENAKMQLDFVTVKRVDIYLITETLVESHSRSRPRPSSVKEVVETQKEEKDNNASN